MRRPSKRHLWITLIAVGLVAGGGIIWYEATHSDPVPEDEVVARFREGGSRATHGGPEPGVYLYEVHGHEQGGAGPLRVPRDLPVEATLAVTGTDTGWQSEMTYSRQHIEASRLALRDQDIVMSWRRVDVSFVGFGRDDRRDIHGIARVVRGDAAVGDRWVDRYRTGTLENTVVNRVLRREPITVGGTRVTALVITSDTTTTGALSGTRRETFWWLPEERLVARSQLRVELGGVFGYESTIDATLRSLAPQR